MYKELFMTDTKAFVESLFNDYEKTPALLEFMEELTGNLGDKVASSVKKGMSREAAFRKAQAELGDISALAAELSLKARQDVFAERYLGIRAYMTAPRVALYVLCGALLAFGLVSASIVYFTMDAQAYSASINDTERMTGVFGVLLAFMTASAAGFTFLGLTQETADCRPMRKKRATLYAAAAGLIVFGCALSPLTYFATGRGLMEAFAVLIPFFLPGVGGLVFLVMTEKSRLKPWAAERTLEEIRRSRELFTDGTAEARFGLYVGAVWVFAFGAFFALGFAIGFRHSWLSFVFAIAIQLAVQGTLVKKTGAGGSQKTAAGS
jgi:uncharacterized membrane protein YidH (DUF202 family)